MNKGFILFFLLACWLGIAFSQSDSGLGIYGSRSGDQTVASDIPSRHHTKHNITPLGGWISVFSEGFDDISSLSGSGWEMINNSYPLGTTDWLQGNGVFTAYDGDNHTYIAANFNNTSGGTISNWLLSPLVSIENGNEFRFWTRTTSGSVNPDRLEVRMSLNDNSSNVGSTDATVGDFSELLWTINQGLVSGSGGYPEAWTQYTIVISGVPEPTSGRFAFRYFVSEGGPLAKNSNFIGIDRVEYLEPTSMVPLSHGAMVFSLGLMVAFSLLFYRRILC